MSCLRRLLGSCIPLFFAVGLFATPAMGEPPSVSYIFPAGAQRGTTVDVRVGGHYLHESCAFTMRGPGIVAPDRIERRPTFWLDGPIIPFPASARPEDYPKDYAARIQISSDAPLGPRRWSVATSQGTTPSRVFVIGELPELTEKERPGAPLPQDVSLPLTINGRIFPHEDVDLWRIEAQQNEAICCQLATTSIGSPLQARLTLLDASGRAIADGVAGPGGEPQLEFVAPASGSYLVRVEDASFGGYQHYVYRLTLRRGHSLRGRFPLGGRRGTRLTLQLPPTGESSTSRVMAIPSEAPAVARYRLGNDLPLVPLAAGDDPEMQEQEPNDEPPQALDVAVPHVLNGRIEKPGDEDLWSVEASKGQPLQIHLMATRLGSRLQPLLRLEDSAGKVLAKFEAGPGGDIEQLWKPPADGTYLVRIGDRFETRGGPDFGYRLQLTEPRPDFALRLESDAITVERGGTASLKVTVERRGGFSGPVQVKVEGLPEGVTCKEQQAKGGQAGLKLEAAEKARIDVHAIRIVGSAELDGETRERYAGWQWAAAEPPLEEVRLAVAMPTPFSFSGVFFQRFVPRGTVHRKTYQLERGGYEGPLEIRLADKQARHLQGVTASPITVPAGAESFQYQVFLPPWMALNRTSRTVIMATGIVKDEEGREHRVCYTNKSPNQQLIAIVSPSLMKLTSTRRSLIATPNAELSLPVQIKKDEQLQGPIQVELIVPGHIEGIACEPIELAAGAEGGELKLRIDEHPGPFNMPLTIRATTRRGDDRVVAELSVELVPHDG